MVALVEGGAAVPAAVPGDGPAAAGRAAAPAAEWRGWVAAVRLTTPRRRLSTVTGRCPAAGDTRVSPVTPMRDRVTPKNGKGVTRRKRLLTCTLRADLHCW